MNADIASLPRRYRCGHCNKSLSKTQFFKHKKLYYNKTHRKWQNSNTQSVRSCDNDSDFDFGCTDSESDDFPLSDNDIETQIVTQSNDTFNLYLLLPFYNISLSLSSLELESFLVGACTKGGGAC